MHGTAKGGTNSVRRARGTCVCPVLGTGVVSSGMDCHGRQQHAPAGVWLQQGARWEQSALKGPFFLQIQKKQQQPCQSTVRGDLAGAPSCCEALGSAAHSHPEADGPRSWAAPVITERGSDSSLVPFLDPAQSQLPLWRQWVPWSWWGHPGVGSNVKTSVGRCESCLLRSTSVQVCGGPPLHVKQWVRIWRKVSASGIIWPIGRGCVFLGPPLRAKCLSSEDWVGLADMGSAVPCTAQCLPLEGATWCCCDRRRGKGCPVALLSGDLILVMNTAVLNRQRCETEAQWGCYRVVITWLSWTNVIENSLYCCLLAAEMCPCSEAEEPRAKAGWAVREGREHPQGPAIALPAPGSCWWWAAPLAEHRGDHHPVLGASMGMLTLEQAAQGGGGVPIPGGVHRTCRCGTSGYGLVGKVVLGGWLDLMILEVLSNLWFSDALGAGMPDLWVLGVPEQRVKLMEGLGKLQGVQRYPAASLSSSIPLVLLSILLPSMWDQLQGYFPKVLGYFGFVFFFNTLFFVRNISP